VLIRVRERLCIGHDLLDAMLGKLGFHSTFR
jgi:hypothetical protein